MSLDPELSGALTAYLERRAADPTPDAASLRRSPAALAPAAGADLLERIHRDELPPAPARDGHRIPLTRYRPAEGGTGGTLLFLHGGGMVAGSRLTAEPTILRLVAASGITIITPEYRLAPEHPNPTPVHDCHAALAHLGREASGLGIDPLRLAIGGDSAGGGLAAATAILARDTGGPRLTAQLLGCPMLDDRTTGPREKWHTWTPADNAIGWSAYLGGAPADHLAAPARAADLGGLPRAFIDTGTLDLFCAEDVRYALRLLEAGVPCDLHVYAGAPHGFASLNPHAGVAKRALAQRAAFLRTI